MSNILTLSISELVSKLKSGDISSVELCSAYIDRYDKFEKDVKAWAYFDKKLLLEKATEADENRKAGKPLGQLHGLPIGIKDIFGTVENFSNMVKKGYPMVWRYNNFEFLNLEETPQGYSQIVRITDQNDKLFLLKYFMKNVAGIWKISGVSIIETSDFSA